MSEVIELNRPAPAVEESRVLVTFLPPRNAIDLPDRGIDERAAADLRARLRSISEDWQRPEMDVYDEL